MRSCQPVASETGSSPKAGRTLTATEFSVCVGSAPRIWLAAAVKRPCSTSAPGDSDVAVGIVRSVAGQMTKALAGDLLPVREVLRVVVIAALFARHAARADPGVLTLKAGSAAR